MHLPAKISNAIINNSVCEKCSPCFRANKIMSRVLAHYRTEAKTI